MLVLSPPYGTRMCPTDVGTALSAIAALPFAPPSYCASLAPSSDCSSWRLSSPLSEPALMPRSFLKILLR